MYLNIRPVKYYIVKYSPLAVLVFFISVCCVSCGSEENSGVTKVANYKSERKDTVLLVGLNFQDRDLLPAITERINSFYHLPTRYIEAPLPSSAFYKPRNRYRADSLLRFLSGLNTRGYAFVAGLTSKDISVTHGEHLDWGIFGLGTLDATACVNSTFRLKKNASKALLSARIQKVVLHELGHNRGLEHCTTKDPCFMKDAEGSIRVVDNEPMGVCASCKYKMRL